MSSYNFTSLSSIELEELLSHHLDAAEINRVICAYELAESVHEHQVRGDGSPYFYHCSRVCRILALELGITDADVLSAALLHDVLEDSETLTQEVIEYNFGRYVAYIVEVLTKDLWRRSYEPDVVDKEHIELLKNSSSDCLLIKLAARLDNFRCLEFNLKRNPHSYIQETETIFLPMVEQSSNTAFNYLTSELRKERNKFLG
ncbi:MAG: bifunctional (p)ppGpp synthetase/guanosine-3',5'-bis(diphosphate) 3'-pyrophosphohydrolase [Ignavibacteria bacterium]|nr:bifunctional (p)ppGpp synthetase/guanosine-3',5'-bis(diphosphate) 3'-pyrophosphohydrolase [Ignavibacteria bacterium]